MNNIIVVIALAIGFFVVAYCASRKRRKTIIVEEVLIDHSSAMQCFISDADERYGIKPCLLGLDDEHMLIEDAFVRVGKSYEITTCGWRISWFYGWHKNIVSIKEVSV